MVDTAREMITSHRSSEFRQPRSANIFEAILHSDLPPSEKSVERLADEGFELIVAGGETVARVASAAIFHLLDNPNMMRRLRIELLHADTTKNQDISASLQDLEKLPWLVSLHLLSYVSVTKI